MNTVDDFSFSSNVANMRIKRKLAAMNRENKEDHFRNIQARNTNSLGIQKDYSRKIYYSSVKKIEGRVTNNLSQEFSRSKSRILGALSGLDEVLQNLQPRAVSGTVPETSRNLSRENLGMNEDGSQNDSHPELGVSLSHSPHELSPGETFYSNCVKKKYNRL